MPKRKHANVKNALSRGWLVVILIGKAKIEHLSIARR